MQYLILNEEATTQPNLRIVEAPSPASALTAYRRAVWATDPDFLGYIADKAVNMSFVERFWMASDGEKKVFEETGEVSATAERFATRLFEAFGNQRELARQYIQYQLDAHDSDESRLPPGLAEFIAAELSGDNWEPLLAIPLSEIPVIHTEIE